MTGRNACPTSGFTLVELMVVLAILLTVTGIIASGMFQMTMTQGTVWNRTEMHGAVRSSTELLQQEIAQGGRITLPPPGTTMTLSGSAVGNGTSQTVAVSSSATMFPGMQLVIGPDVTNGPSQETITLTAVGANSITAVFQDPHAIGASIGFLGSFSAGIVPLSGDKIISITSGGTTQVTTLTATTGSSGTVLKMFGDVNGDGNIVFIKYVCSGGTTAAPGTLTRSVTPITAATLNPAQLLLTNVLTNPGGVPCFDYQRKVVGNSTYVVNVTVTLTVQTEYKDPKTRQFQTETMALLNVSPRNVFEAWQLASGGILSRIQPMPYSVVQLIGLP